MENQNFNLLLAILLSIGIIVGWQYYFERPRLATEVTKHKEYKKEIHNIKKSQPQEKLLRRDQAVSGDSRIHFSNDYVAGSINPVGLRIDDLRLLKYKETIKPGSEDVKLLNPNNTKDSYFAEIGWVSSNKNITIPNNKTIWNCAPKSFGNGNSTICSWTSPENVDFKAEFALDDKYMFSIKQEVMNNSESAFPIRNYGIIYKTYDFESSRMSVVHEGVTGVFDGSLKEYSYKDIRDKKLIATKSGIVDWLGITDKYWLVAFVPEKECNYSCNTNYSVKNTHDRYQVDFLSLQNFVEPGESYKITSHLFAGAKKIEILDQYEDKLGIKLFDRTVDFGWFYIITRPLLWVLHFFYDLVGNFGVSIMIVTVLVKLSMFTLANRSYRSMKVMKELQPEIERIKKNCGDDKARFNQEVMNLYKAHKVNPLSGCLPIFIQIPVFFSLYKVLNVSIEMRHAPFFGWINDLSVADPTNIFNLFGLIPWVPPAYLHIGVWPLLMAFTMYLQQLMSPPATDPVQAQMMRLLPLIFLFMFGSFPAGLLIYWTWNNILSIAQQGYINYSNEKSS